MIIELKDIVGRVASSKEQASNVLSVLLETIKGLSDDKEVAYITFKGLDIVHLDFIVELIKILELTNKIEYKFIGISAEVLPLVSEAVALVKS